MILHPNFVFAHLTKTGGTFIEDFLVKNVKGSEYIGTFLSRNKIIINNRPCRIQSCRHDSLYKFIEKDDERIKFGYVRNPYDWYLSFWAFSKKGHNTYIHLFDTAESYKNINIFVKSLFNSDKSLCYYKNGLTNNTNSNELSHINLSVAKNLDIGLLTYKYLLLYYNHDVFHDIENYKEYKFVDKVLRFENLTKELDEFFSKNLFKLNEKQKYMLYNSPKKRTSIHGHYSKYYTKEIIDLIRHKDKIIFKEYNYEF